MANKSSILQVPVTPATSDEMREVAKANQTTVAGLTRLFIAKGLHDLRKDTEAHIAQRAQALLDSGQCEDPAEAAKLAKFLTGVL